MARMVLLITRWIVQAVLAVAWFSGHLAFWVAALMSAVVNIPYLTAYWFSARRVAGPESGLRARPDDLVFIGGGRWPRPWGRRFRWQGANATWPLVELRIGGGRVLVRLRWKLIRGVFSPFLGAVDLPLGEATVDPINALFGGGVRLATADNVGVIFWTFERQAVIDALVAGGAHIGKPDRVW